MVLSPNFPLFYKHGQIGWSIDNREDFQTSKQTNEMITPLMALCCQNQ
jgi:hypothetical protein